MSAQRTIEFPNPSSNGSFVAQRGVKRPRQDQFYNDLSPTSNQWVNPPRQLPAQPAKLLEEEKLKEIDSVPADVSSIMLDATNYVQDPRKIINAYNAWMLALETSDRNDTSATTVPLLGITSAESLSNKDPIVETAKSFNLHIKAIPAFESLVPASSDQTRELGESLRCFRCNQVNMTDMLRYTLEDRISHFLSNADPLHLSSEWKLPSLPAMLNVQFDRLDTSNMYSLYLYARNMITIMFDTLLSQNPNIVDLHLGFPLHSQFSVLYGKVLTQGNIANPTQQEQYINQQSILMSDIYNVIINVESFAPMFTIIMQFLRSADVNGVSHFELLPISIRSFVRQYADFSNVQRLMQNYKQGSPPNQPALSELFISLNRLQQDARAWLIFYHTLYAFIIQQLVRLGDVLWLAWRNDFSDRPTTLTTPPSISSTISNAPVTNSFRTTLLIELQTKTDQEADQYDLIIESVFKVPLERGFNVWSTIAGTSLKFDRPLCARCKSYYYLEQLEDRHGMTTDQIIATMFESQNWFSKMMEPSVNDGTGRMSQWNNQQEDENDYFDDETFIRQLLLSQGMSLGLQHHFNTSPSSMFGRLTLSEIVNNLNPSLLKGGVDGRTVGSYTNITLPWRQVPLQRAEINYQDESLISKYSTNNITLDRFNIGYVGVKSMMDTPLYTFNNNNSPLYQFFDAARLSNTSLSSNSSLPPTPLLFVDEYHVTHPEISEIENRLGMGLMIYNSIFTDYLLALHYQIVDEQALLIIANRNHALLLESTWSMLSISKRMLSAPITDTMVVGQHQLSADPNASSSSSSSSSPPVNRASPSNRHTTLSIRPYALHQPSWFDQTWIGPQGLRQGQKVWFILPVAVASVQYANTPMQSTILVDYIQCGTLIDIGFFDPNAYTKQQNELHQTSAWTHTPFALKYDDDNIQRDYFFHQTTSQYAIVDLQSTVSDNFGVSLVDSRSNPPRIRSINTRRMLVPFAWIIDPYLFVTHASLLQLPNPVSVTQAFEPLLQVVKTITDTLRGQRGVQAYDLLYQSTLEASSTRLSSMWQEIEPWVNTMLFQPNNATITVRNSSNVQSLPAIVYPGSLFGFLFCTWVPQLMADNENAMRSLNINRRQNNNMSPYASSGSFGNISTIYTNNMMKSSSPRSSTIRGSTPSVFNRSIVTQVPVTWATWPAAMMVRLIALILMLHSSQTKFEPNIRKNPLFYTAFLKNSDHPYNFIPSDFIENGVVKYPELYQQYGVVIQFLRYFFAKSLHLIPTSIRSNWAKNYSANMFRGPLAVAVLHLWKKDPATLQALFSNPSIATQSWKSSRYFNDLVDTLYNVSMINPWRSGLNDDEMALQQQLESTQSIFLQQVVEMMKFQQDTLKPML